MAFPLQVCGACVLTGLLGLVLFAIYKHWTKPEVLAELPSQLLAGATGPDPFVEGLRELANEYAGAVQSWSARTHLQQLASGPEPVWDTLVDSRWQGRMLHLKGKVSDVTLFEPGDNDPAIVWLWLSVGLQRGGFLDVIAEFDYGWQDVLTKIDKGTPVQLVGAFRSLRTNTHGQVVSAQTMSTNVQKWLGSDPPALNALHFRVSGRAIARCSDDRGVGSA